MQGLVGGALRVAGRQFLAQIHPDRFTHLPQRVRENETTFKIISRLTLDFCKLLDDGERIEGRRLVMDGCQIRFSVDNGEDGSLIEHKLIFLPKYGIQEGPSWEACALCLFHLYIKADIQCDSRLIRMLLQRVSDGQSRDYYLGNDHNFSKLLREDSEKTETFTLERAAKVMQRFDNFIFIDGTCTNADRLEAISSIWHARETLSRLDGRYRVLISPTPNVSPGSFLLRLLPRFTAHDLKSIL